MSAGQESLQHQTIVRIRGELVLWLEVVGTIGDGFTKFSAGIGIVSADAFAIGVTAMPNPGNDDEWPGWMWHHSAGSLVGLSVTEADNTGPISQVRIPIDSKAMRKWRSNEVLFGSVQLDTLIGAATVRFAMNTRILVKV